MQHRKTLLLLCTSGFTLLVLAGLGFWLLTPQPVAAQCGSQASSCKSCHEVQAQFSVNSDGTGWHESHAFGDFCTLCHAGNQQATEADLAHEGMVPPLEDVAASCQQCHAADLDARSQVYADVLGLSLVSEPVVPADAPSDRAPASEETGSVEQVMVVPAASESCAPALLIDDPNAVDYAQRYNQIVLGEQPTNWGNIVLGGLIGLIAVGGGGFVVLNEMRINAATKAVDAEYPADVVDMLPDIAALKPRTRQALRKVLANPRRADKVLTLVDDVVSNDTPEE